MNSYKAYNDNFFYDMSLDRPAWANSVDSDEKPKTGFSS